MSQAKIEARPYLVMSMPQLFTDPDFVKWLDNNAGKGVATWHVSGNMPEADEEGNVDGYHDVFMHCEVWDGGISSSEEGVMPEHCHKQIEDALSQTAKGEYLLRITNV